MPGIEPTRVWNRGEFPCAPTQFGLRMANCLVQEQIRNNRTAGFLRIQRLLRFLPFDSVASLPRSGHSP
jgi:hypothetical protein